MATLHLKLFGAFEAWLDDGPALLVSAHKAQALLAYLAMSRGQPRTRQHLADLLWGLSGEEQARNSLRQTLFVLRRGLGGFSGLVGRGNCLSLDPGTYRVDALDLEDLAGQDDGSVPENAGEPYAGILLDGFSLHAPAFEDWLEAARRRCHDLAQTVLRRQLVHLEKTGSVVPAIDTAQRLLALDPLQEDIHRTLIRLYVSQGRHGDAVRQTDLCRETLRRELGVPISLETEQVLKAAVAGPRRLDLADPHASGAKREHPQVVVVFPFTCDGHDRNVDAVATGLAADITANLAAWRMFRVVSRRSLVALRASDVDPSASTARYVIDGSVRRIGDLVQINAQLLDAAGAYSVWATRLIYRLNDILDLREEIALRICGAVAPVLERLELRPATPEIEPVDAWGYSRRGMQLVNRLTKKTNAAARVMFERAIALDPTCARAYAGLARVHARDHINAFVRDRALARARCIEAARRAIDLDPFEWDARCSLAHPLRHEGDHDLAIMELERAVTLNPSSGGLVVALGHTLDGIGRAADGLTLIRRGFALSPTHVKAGPLSSMARAALNSRDYDTAIDIARKAIPQYSDCPQLYFHLASSLGHVGKRREGQAALRAAEEVSPGFAKIYTPSYARQSDQEHYFDGLAAAGWG